MRDDYPQFRERDAEVIAVAPDNPEALRAYWERERIPFPGLADPEHKVADRYGQAVRWLRFGRMPSLLVLDRDGVPRLRHDGRSMRDIPANRDILALLDRLPRSGRGNPLPR